jgi:hypothetical protein
MKIQSVQSYGVTNKKQNQVQSNPLLINSNVGKDIFKPSFGMEITTTVHYGDEWMRGALREAWSKSGGIRDLAESFHKSAQGTIQEIGSIVSDSVYKSKQVQKFFGLIEKTIQVEDYDATSKVVEKNTEKLSSEIKSVIQGKNKMSKEISQLELKAAKGTDNNTDQQVRVQKIFGRFVEAEKEGMEVDIPNGILVHGGFDTKNTDFVKWIAKNTPVFFDEESTVIKHNPQKPLDTIGAIISKAEDAKNLFKATGKRTLLFVDNLDEMLSDYSTIERRGMIGRFKGFVEHISKDYHTTLVMKTSKPLEDFEPASIGSNRFEIKVPIKDGISEKEAKKLEELKAEVKRIDDKADRVENDYWEDGWDSTETSYTGTTASDPNYYYQP